MELRKLSGFLFLLFSLLLASAVDSHASFFNWGSCLRWRITGICRIVCHNFGCNVWVRVRHWRPDEVSETVNIPGDSIWAESFPGILGSIFGGADSQIVSALSGNGGGGVRTASGPIMNEKFYESHVFGVPWEVMVVDQPFLAAWGCQGGNCGAHLRVRARSALAQRLARSRHQCAVVDGRHLGTALSETGKGVSRQRCSCFRASFLSGHGFNRWSGQQRDPARPSDTDELYDSRI